VGWDSVVGVATCYGLDGPGSNPGGGKNFRTRPDRPRGPSSLSTMGTGSLSLRVNRSGRRVNHQPQPSADFKERIEPYLYSPSGSS
jgi:hypothetical protein